MLSGAHNVTSINSLDMTETILVAKIAIIIRSLSEYSSVITSR